ncbi:MULTISPECIES: acyltransferase [unclassified Spirosoma]|uniref:acyltransferase family protein n=1 Tax=unclassified Spirosoma TaxID=2621999 RepID=UPI0009620C4C|nr:MULTISPECIES: acyltransferase [unclassified Spirosoma]MBN8826343.1 acyltransferase [Spirosoma sp.]OJW76140.1 MAG: acyltransferase [Spirosoma sp. 48-14]
MTHLPERDKSTKPVEVKTTRKLYGLDHLRALAIGFVFLFHYFILSNGQPEWLPELARFGWTGVDLFFVLSGFLIASQLFEDIKQRRKISLGGFFLKRFFRIIPPYLVTVGLYFCIPAFREKEALPPLWKFLTFTQNFDLDLKHYGTFSHAWSLCVEEHFYLLLPLILVIYQSVDRFNRSGWLLLALFFFGFGARLYSLNVMYAPYIGHENSWLYWYKYVYYPTYNRLDGLLIGVSVAGVYTFHSTLWHRVSKQGNVLLAAGVLLLILAYWMCEDQQTLVASVFGFPLLAISYGFVVAGAISPTSFMYNWKSTISASIATLSFAIYLTHKGIIKLTHGLLEGTNWDSNWVLFVCIMTSLLGAILLHVLVEKPFLKIRNSILNSIN